jgi:hypothetical protein
VEEDGGEREKNGTETHLARVRPPHPELVQFLSRREAFGPFLDAALNLFSQLCLEGTEVEEEEGRT